MSDAPHEIHIQGYGDYILATPTALSDHPTVKALVAEAEARGMERAEVLCQIEIDRGDRNDRPTYALVARVCRDAIRAKAAAIRKGETT